MNDIKQRLIAHDNAFEIIQQENIRMHEAFIELCVQELSECGLEVPAYDYNRVELSADWSVEHYGRLTVDGDKYVNNEFVGYVAAYDVSVYVAHRDYYSILFVLNGRE